ncbi:MAG: ABC transporter substrate-binding protein [Spirochaetales bacterium]|jgi:peptide/nickel transport system substrate-binding protein|nr:ABC transporter substrate-binding protein [Spirochaetales bacterium]
MRTRTFLLIVVMLVSAAMLFAGGDKESDTSTAGSSTSMAATSSSGIQPGYYNLADFEQMTGARITDFNEAPLLAERVAAGDLPPLEDRLPDTVLVMKSINEIGLYGGTLISTSFNTDQDWNLRHINILNLVETPASSSYDTVSTVLGAPLQPGILESFGMSPDGLVFTAKIREGLKWSDGVPVTTADVAFAMDDVFLNTELSPTPKPWLTWGQATTVVEIVDDYTFKATFGSPYGTFIESELRIWPSTFNRLMFPAHYMKMYHKDYAKQADLLKEMADEGYQTIDEWPEFFNDKLGMFGADAFELDNGKVFPTLRPYVPIEDLGNGNVMFERNPYYPAIDEAGNQLPYIDYIRRTYVSDAEVLNMHIISGQTDYSCFTLTIDNYPLYKEHENDGDYTVMPLSAWQDQIQIYLFNMYTNDEALRDVYGDVRFRRAMSVALDRETMNDSMYLGLGRPAQVAPRPGLSHYKDGMEEAWAQYDTDLAKSLLDEMGMKDIDGDGWRERPDGEEFVMKYEYFIITGASTPGSEFAQRYWEDVGVKVDVKQIDPGYYWDSLYPNNEQEATCWWLAGSGANLVQGWFLEFMIGTPDWWELRSKIGTDEEQEIRDKMPEWAEEMVDIRLQLASEPSEARRNEIATRVWELQSEYLPVIGVATDTKTPFAISNDIGNVQIAEEMNYNMLTVMEFSEHWYFTDPERRK